MYDSTIPRRIRNRREERRLAAYQLARMAKISPSYLSMIEAGRKLPSVDVAIRLAKVLRDDPELYRAWAESGSEPDLDGQIERLERMRDVTLEAPAQVMRTRAPFSPSDDYDASEDEELSDVFLGSVMNLRSQTRRDPTEPIRIPLLPAGGDPDDLDAYGSEELDFVNLDPKLLPDDSDENYGELFAYRAAPVMIERVRQLISPGDIVVLAPAGDRVEPGAVYAVRLNSRVLFSRLVYHEPLLLLTGTDPYADPVSIEAGSPRRLARVLAGVVVTTVRIWSRSEEPERARLMGPSLGRSGRYEDGNIVRDCEWKDKYGWRPVQRPEDMDYLDEHPDATIQFRLLRDGEVKFVLEMNAEQWRQGLGTYYEHGMWRENGYVVAVTKRKDGVYTEEFQRRWADFINGD